MSIAIKTATDHIRRSPFQAAAAFFVLTVTFFVITMLSIIVYSSEQLIQHFETRPQVIAFLKDEAEISGIEALRTTLEDDFRVAKVLYVSKEEALEIYKRATRDNPLLSELVSPSIFPASLELSLNDLSYAQEVIGEIKSSEIVDTVDFTANIGGEETLRDVVERLRTVTRYVRIGGAVFAGVLTGTSLLVLIIIIGMRMTTRRGEIEILDLIGATPGFIRNPVILEAIIYTLGGVFFGWFLALLLVLYSTPSLISYFDDIPVLPRDTIQLFFLFSVILASELFTGLVLSVFGSALALSRVKKKR